ncbi:MAG: phage protease, partial [Myxococcota bacterium]
LFRRPRTTALGIPRIVHLARNRAAEADLLTGAICVELALVEGQAPEWVHLLPLGPEIRGRDGRRWTMPDPEAVVQATQAREMPAQVDYQHASEFRRQDGSGVEAPAAGWITELNIVREPDAARPQPGVWGRVEWTPRGGEAVRNREYRFLSPAFLFRKENGEVARITSAGLVHKPNLTMLHALNGRGDETDQENAMKEEERKALCRKLGLPEDASVDAIMTRVADLDAAHKALNGRGEVVPKAELETAINRAETAEKKLKEHEQAAFNARVESVLDKAQKAGKFPPASRDFYKALCTSTEALDRLEKEMEARPALVTPDQPSPAEGQATNAAGGRPTSLTTEEKAICVDRGISEENYLRAKQEEWDRQYGKEA